MVDGRAGADGEGDGRRARGARPCAPADIAELQGLVDSGALNDKLARQVLAGVLAGEGSPAAVVEARGLAVVSDDTALEAAVDAALAADPDVLAKIRDGKVAAAGRHRRRGHEGDGRPGRRGPRARDHPEARGRRLTRGSLPAPLPPEDISAGASCSVAARSTTAVRQVAGPVVDGVTQVRPTQSSEGAGRPVAPGRGRAAGEFRHDHAIEGNVEAIDAGGHADNVVRGQIHVAVVAVIAALHHLVPVAGPVADGGPSRPGFTPLAP